MDSVTKDGITHLSIVAKGLMAWAVYEAMNQRVTKDEAIQAVQEAWNAHRWEEPSVEGMFDMIHQAGLLASRFTWCEATREVDGESIRCVDLRRHQGQHFNPDAAQWWWSE